MFSKNLSQRIQRHNTIPIKILFRIEIKKITFLSLNFLNENEINEISLCFERGGKIATTTEKQIYYKENEVLFNEILSLVVTMYKNNNNNEYQVLILLLLLLYSLLYSLFYCFIVLKIIYSLIIRIKKVN